MADDVVSLLLQEFPAIDKATTLHKSIMGPELWSLVCGSNTNVLSLESDISCFGINDYVGAGHLDILQICLETIRQIPHDSIAFNVDF